MDVKGCSYKNVTLEKEEEVLSEHFLMDDNIWHTEYKQCLNLSKPATIIY